MNDFTKEELVLLACWSVNRYEQVGNDQAQDEGTISLSHKIQGMIVNFCEHKNIAQCVISEQSVCCDCGEELH